MPKIKKSPIFQYGIEITKPHSKEMYSHNDHVAEEMKANILSEIHLSYSQAIGNIAANGGMAKGEERLRELGTAIEGSGYGEGYELDEIKNNIIKSLDNMANWQLHEEYSYLSFKNGIVPRTRFMMVGFEWQKHDYSFCTDIDISPIARMEEQTKNL